MVKAKNENNTDNSGTMLTAADGTQYFVMGKVRIKVSELMIYLYQRVLYKRGLFLFKEDF